jgi:predicted transcriptional regulator YdeE/DNA-binding HxlR family transcriptional regulator
MTDQPFESEEARKAFLMETVYEISELLKTLQHPKRLEILSLMLTEEQEFGTLMRKINLPKSALGNHLSDLLEMNLIEKLDRGLYQISPDGKDFLIGIAENYLVAKIREKERLERQQRRYQDIISRYTRHSFPDDATQTTGSVSRRSISMKIKVENQSAITVMGLKGRGIKPENFIPNLWKEFLGNMEKFEDRIKSKVLYGISYEKNKETKEFSYLVGAEIDPLADVPEGMIVYTIPESLYAVVQCTIPTLFDAWTSGAKWIKENGYQDISKNYPEYELYPEHHKDEETDPIYIYIPVIKPI